MALVVVLISLAAAGTYWYLNRHKPLKHILNELRSTMDMNGAGLAGIIDDWVHLWRNKLVLPDATNKVAVVTGGGRGIGKEVVRQLLKANVQVVIGIRNPELLKSLAETMENPQNLHSLKLDLTSLKSVKEFSDEVLRHYPRINYLVNNAGIMFGDYSLTEDGIEKQFSVNHVSHFYLTHLLMPALKRAGSVENMARVVNVSSCGHFQGNINFEDINSKIHYDTTAAYAQSKLAQIMSARYINKMLENKNIPVRCYAVHPGMVNTDLFEHSLISKLPWATRLFFKTPLQGATSILYTCFNKELEKKGGLYISNCAEGFSNSLSKNVESQRRLHELSCQLAGIQIDSFAS